MKGFIKGLLRRAYAIWKRMTGKARHASNDDYNIQREVYELLSAGELTADKILKTDNEWQRELLENVCGIANRRKAGELAGEAQIDEIKAFISGNVKHMTTEFLDCIEQIAMSSGLFALAYAVRENNEELVQERADCKGFLSASTGNAAGRNAVKLFWCYIKRGEDDKAKELLESAAVKGKTQAYSIIRELCMAFGLLPRDYGVAESSPENRAFADYVRDKRIAIVGPSSSGIDQSEEIKQGFDIIVRMAYRGFGSQPKTGRELAVNVSFYTGEYVRLFLTNPSVDASFLKDLDFAVLKRCDEQTRRKISQFTNIRFAMYPGAKFFFLGKPNQIPIILQDLSNFRPSCVKIFNANLFLSDTLYDKEYVTPSHIFKHDDRLRLMRTFSKHSLISQYDYVRELHCRGIIEADEGLSKVLNFGTAEYMSRMEKQENRIEA